MTCATYGTGKRLGAEPFGPAPSHAARVVMPHTPASATRGRQGSVDDSALMEGARNHVELLLTGELDEVHRVAGDAHGQVRVLLRMLDGVLKLLLAQDVDVRVIQAMAVARVKDADEGFDDDLDEDAGPSAEDLAAIESDSFDD